MKTIFASNKTRLVAVTILLISAHALYSVRTKKMKPETKKTEESTQKYVPKTFNFHDQGVALSDSQLEQHMKLYQGYVKKRNEIDTALEAADRSNVANITYSPYRSLKIAQVFAHNGSLLHELYFENLGKSAEPDKKTLALIEKNYGSLENFKTDLLAAASCARGWVITGYCLDDQRVKNFVLDAHHENVPVLVVPLLVVDIYEHAYMVDYGINRADYLKDLWNNINWGVVEERVGKWVK